MTPSVPSRVSRLGFAFMASCVSAVLLYGALRIVQKHLFPEADPATVLFSPHAGYYWRCWTVVYAGVMIGFVAYGAAKKHAHKTAWALNMALRVAVIVIIFQGLFVP